MEEEEDDKQQMNPKNDKREDYEIIDEEIIKMYQKMELQCYNDCIPFFLKNNSFELFRKSIYLHYK